MHLDGASLWVCRRLESLEGILKLEAVGDQSLKIHDTSLQQTDGSGPCIGVAVLELEVDLAGAEAHEGDLDFVLADANDEDLAAELDSLDGTCDGALNTGALESDGRLDATTELGDGFCEVFGGVAEVHLVGADRRAELLGELQTALIDVGNDDGLGTGGLDTGESDETNGTGTADQDGVTESDFCSLNTCQSNTEGLKERTVLEAHVTDLVAPHGGVVDIAAEEARDGRSGTEEDRVAAIVATGQARLALAADDVGLDGNAVADLERLDVVVHGNNDACRLVAENVVIFNNHGTDAAGVPEVNIRSCRRQLSSSVSCGLNLPANTSALDCDCDLARSQLLLGLNLLERRLGLGDPKIMCRVGVNTNVGQRRLDDCLC